MKWTEEKLIDFELKVKTAFEKGLINCPIHLSGGNEEQLVSLFGMIKKKDWVFSTHRNHYHYLLKGGDPDRLYDEILGKSTGICKGQGRSMHIYDTSINFYTSGIVGGNCAPAVGVGLALKKKKSKAHVWCFLGDGGEDTGHFWEAVRFGLARHLPLTFVVEDNDLAVESTKEMRWQHYPHFNSKNVIKYHYERHYPHVGIGKHIGM